MEKTTFINILTQAAELIQKKGILSLKEAGKLINSLNKIQEFPDEPEKYPEDVQIVINYIGYGQSLCPFSLRDSAILYTEISKFQEFQNKKKDISGSL